MLALKWKCYFKIDILYIFLMNIEYIGIDGILGLLCYIGLKASGCGVVD